MSVLGVGQRLSLWRPSRSQPSSPSCCLWSLVQFPRAIVSRNCLASVLMHLGGHWEMHVEHFL